MHARNTCPLGSDCPAERVLAEEAKLVMATPEPAPKTFEDWWRRTGKFIDPDTSDVPWFDKREGLAAAAFAAAMAISGNYVADHSASPYRIEFPNGRQVAISNDGKHLVVGRAVVESN